jgi:antitoxin component YwqK of YwqJK toxin-antitoxin module
MAVTLTSKRVAHCACRWLQLCWVLAISCTQPEEKINQIVMNSEGGNFSQLNGVVLLDGQPYTGTIYTLFPDSRDTARIVQYLVGMEHGIWKQFYPGGKLLDRREFNRGQKVGEVISWYENGQKKLHYYFENDLYEGTGREWNEDGTLVLEKNYHAGHEEGAQHEYHDNGEVRSSYVVKDGRRYSPPAFESSAPASDSLRKQ